MFLNQSIGRTFDLFPVTKAAQQPAYQGGLARAEVSHQVNAQARNEHFAKLRSQGQRGSFVGKSEG